jgi:hypothetical protein
MCVLLVPFLSIIVCDVKYLNYLRVIFIISRHCRNEIGFSEDIRVRVFAGLFEECVL